MKKIIKEIFAHPIVCLLIIISLVFLPMALVAQPEATSRLIVSFLAIDKNDDNFEATAVAYIPKSTQTFSENYKVISSKGKTLYEAISNVGVLAGKIPALAHANLIIVNDRLCEEGLLSSFDYLKREYGLGSDTIVMNTSVSAKDILTSANELSVASGISLGEISTFNDQNIIHKRSDVESIYSASFAPNKSSILMNIELEEEGIDIGGSPTSGSSSGDLIGETPGSAGSGEESGGAKKKLANKGTAVVLKEGKKIMNLSTDDVKNLNWMKKSNNSVSLTLKNYSDENFTNSTLTLLALKNKVKFNPHFENQNPVLNILIMPEMGIVEVNQELIDKNIYVSKYKFATDKMLEVVKNRIITQTRSVLDKLVANNADILSIYQKFDSKDTRQFERYLNSLENRDDYLRDIEINIDVSLLIE